LSSTGRRLVDISWHWARPDPNRCVRVARFEASADRSVDQRPSRVAVVGLRRSAVVAMVQATDLGNGHDRAECWRRDRPGVWRVLGEREMRSRLVIVREVPGQHARQSGFIHDDHVIEALASNGADDAPRIRVLPRRAWRGEDLMNPHPGRRWSDPREGVISISGRHDS
jgi:hypothetical protein